MKENVQSLETVTPIHSFHISHFDHLVKNSTSPRAIISAIDGMIDAEKEREITAIDGLIGSLTMGWHQETGTKSNLVNFTATFSFAPCAV